MKQKISLTNAILLVLEKTVDGVVRLSDFANNPGYYNFGGGWEYPLDKSAISLALRRLRERGLVEKDHSEGEVIFKLTKAGKNKAILMKAEDENWDGRYRIVIFDIPEARRGTRKFLREKLKEWGFVKWQKSVWACKKNCTSQLEEVIKETGIDDWVLVVESAHVGPRSF